MDNNILFMTISDLKLRKKRLVSEYCRFISILNHFVLLGNVSKNDALLYKKREAMIYRMQVREIKVLEALFDILDSATVVQNDILENVETVRQFKESPEEIQNLVLERLAA